MYNVTEDINPPQKTRLLQEAISHMDRYIAELWKEREQYSSSKAMQEMKRGIEQKEVQETIAGFRQYHEEFQQYTCERIWENTRGAMGHALNPKGIIVGQWHFPYIQQRLHDFAHN